MASKLRNDVWLHFNKIDENTVHCKMCSSKLSHKSTTSTMHYHLVFVHKMSCNTRQATQTSIASFTVRQKCNAARAEKITQLITEMVEKDLLPISFVVLSKDKGLKI